MSFDNSLPKWAEILTAEYEEPEGVWGPYTPGNVPPPLASRMYVEGNVPHAINEGRHNGYPECCIRHFVETGVRSHRDGFRPNIRLHPTDHRVMCDRCAAELKN